MNRAIAAITAYFVLLATNTVSAAPVQQVVAEPVPQWAILGGGMGLIAWVLVTFINKSPKGANQAFSDLASALSTDAQARIEQTKLDRDEFEIRKKELAQAETAQSKMQSSIDTSYQKWVDLSERMLKAMDENSGAFRAQKDSVNDGFREHEHRAEQHRLAMTEKLDGLDKSIKTLSNEVLGGEEKPSIRAVLSDISAGVAGLRNDLLKPEPPADATPKTADHIQIQADTVTVNAPANGETKGTEHEAPNPDPSNPPVVGIASAGTDAAAGTDRSGNTGGGPK